MGVDIIETRSRPKPVQQADLLQWVKDYVPTLRARRGEIEALARMPDDVLKDFEEAGVYSMMVPRAYGGMEANFSYYLDVVRELGRGDAGIAWAVSLVNVCNWVISTVFPMHVVDKVFANPHARAAGMFDCRGVQARKVDGGIHIDKGMWFFNSGCPQADWDLLAVPSFDDAGTVVGMSMALIPMEHVTILGDWDTSGLRGSGSNNVTVENLFVPQDYLVDMKACAEGTMTRPFPEGDLWYSAFSPATVVILAFPLLGAARHMLEEFLKLIPTRGIRLTKYEKQSEAAVMHHTVGQASAKIDAAQLLMEAACRKIDEYAARHEDMPLEERARIIRDCAYADRLVWEGVDMLAGATSGSFARRTYTMNGIWQDVRVGTMHPYISYFSNLEMYGRLACGVEDLLMPV